MECTEAKLDKHRVETCSADWDAIVVGGGPAGGHCARVLARLGQRVLLLERHQSFRQNQFSSAGTPLETLQRYQLPPSVVGSVWRRMVILTSQQRGEWASTQPQGVVLDFGRLREFLATEVQRLGGQVWMGHRYVSHQQDGETVQVRVKGASGEALLTARVLVDATGPSRAVMYDRAATKPAFLSGTGIEYLVEVTDAAYRPHADALTFFLGHRWMPRGYAWIFPMAANQLKVGAGFINLEHQIVKQPQSLRFYIDRVMHNYLHLQQYQLLDLHGSTLKYSRGLQDVYYRGRTIAIGDAVSTVNFLGGEGIRFGMQSAEIAARHIQRALHSGTPDFASYQREMHQTFLAQWQLTERLGLKKYLEDNDTLVDQVVNYLRPLTLEEVVDVLFYYRFERLSRGVLPYLGRKLRQFGRSIQQNLSAKGSVKE